MSKNITEKAVEKEKKKAKKKVKKAIRRTIRTILWTCFVLTCGVFIGIHWKVISAWIKGEAIEKIQGHCPVWKK